MEAKSAAVVDLNGAERTAHVSKQQRTTGADVVLEKHRYLLKAKHGLTKQIIHG